MWDKELTGRFYHEIQPKVSFKVKFKDVNRHKEVTLTRLRFGKGLLGDTLYKIGRQNSNLCQFCHVKEDVKHYLCECANYQDLQVEVNDKVLMTGSVPSAKNLLREEKWFNDVWSYVIQTKRDI